MTSLNLRRLAAVFLSVLLFAALGPGFIRTLKPAPREGIDFFQDWSSARNWRENVPIYTDLRFTAERYLGRRFAPGEEAAVLRNAHPPSSVLITLPFAWLSYPTATAVWNALSILCFGSALWIIARVRGTRPHGWWILPAAALLLTCNPFRHQVEMGQINGLLLALLVGMWVADRFDWYRTAGVLLAIATAIKLTPGLFFVFYVLRRRWSVVIWGALAGMAITALTAAVIGLESYESYLKDVLPLSSRYTPMRINASLAGLWSKWFDTGVVSHLTLEQIARPLSHNPVIARVGFAVSAAIVLYFLARTTTRARLPEQIDLATGGCVSAMLLLSPATWDHSFLLLALPAAALWPLVAPRRATSSVFWPTSTA